MVNVYKGKGDALTCREYKCLIQQGHLTVGTCNEGAENLE